VLKIPQDPRKQILSNASKRAKRKKKKKTPNKGQEKRCVDNFRHLGQSEVETPLGYIDLLTKDYIVEFKIYTRAKDALGQILCYDEFIKGRKRLIVLFGKGLCSWKGKVLFQRVCAKYNVELFCLSNNYVYKNLRRKLGDTNV
jgi:hypothetical protein